jgi:tetratricopeptide (TPR) repeat protein
MRAGTAVLDHELAKALHTNGILPDHLHRLADAIPEGYLPHTSVVVAQLQVDQARQAEPVDLAGSLTNLGNCLHELGRPSEALPHHEEAVSMYRQLDIEDPVRHRPDLAGSLFNLGNCLHELGRPDEMFTVRREVVGLERWLAEQDPDLYQQSYQQTLSALRRALADAGRLAESVALHLHPPTPAATAPRRQNPRIEPSAHPNGIEPGGEIPPGHPAAWRSPPRP